MARRYNVSHNDVNEIPHTTTAVVAVLSNRQSSKPESSDIFIDLLLKLMWLYINSTIVLKASNNLKPNMLLEVWRSLSLRDKKKVYHFASNFYFSNLYRNILCALSIYTASSNSLCINVGLLCGTPSDTFFN